MRKKIILLVFFLPLIALFALSCSIFSDEVKEQFYTINEVDYYLKYRKSNNNVEYAADSEDSADVSNFLSRYLTTEIIATGLMYDFVIKQLPDIYTTPVSAIKFWMQLTKTGKWFNIELDTLYETSTKTDVWKINVNVRRSNATKYSWYLLENKVIDETPSSLEKTGECILTSTDWGNAKVVDTSERYINFYDKDDSLINLGFYLSPYEWPNVSFFVESAEANT